LSQIYSTNMLAPHKALSSAPTNPDTYVLSPNSFEPDGYLFDPNDLRNRTTTRSKPYSRFDALVLLDREKMVNAAEHCRASLDYSAKLIA
jgi:hypothetical protein